MSYLFLIPYSNINMLNMTRIIIVLVVGIVITVSIVADEPLTSYIREVPLKRLYLLSL